MINKHVRDYSSVDYLINIPHILMCILVNMDLLSVVSPPSSVKRRHVDAAADRRVLRRKNKQSNQIIIKDPAGLFLCSPAFSSLTAD